MAPQNMLRTYYFNPVYQSADGSVYAVSGSGFTFHDEAYGEGSVYSQTMDATVTTTANGKAKTDSTSVTLSISTMFAPEKIAVLQMDAGSAILSKAEYAPDAVPASISLEPQTAYLIVETHKRDDAGQINISREIYGSDAESIETFFAREDGICEKQWTEISWPE